MGLRDYAITVAMSGLGGFDPIPVLVLVAALGAGIRRRDVVAAAGILIGGTALLGFGLTEALGPALRHVGWHHVLRGGPLAAGLELAVGLALSAYLGWRAGHRDPPSDDPSRRATSASGLFLGTLVWVAIVVADPAFDVHVVAAAGEPWPVGLAGWLAWAAISQFPVVLLAAGIAGGLEERVMAWLRRALSQWRPVLWWSVTILVGLAAALALADAASFFLRGQFLVR